MTRKINYFNNKYYETYKSVSKIRQKGDKPYLYAYWRRYLKRLKPKGKLLDIGCGLGFFLKRVEDIYEAYGIDISEYAVDEARKVSIRAKINICSALELSFVDNSFDIVTAFDVVEHLNKPDLFFKEVHRIMAKEGILVISTANTISLGAKRKGKEWSGLRDNTHISLLPIGEWRNLLEKWGFSIIRDGTDFLWDAPYFKYIPYKLQWLFFVGLTWILVWINGFYSWKFGENYICVAKKV